MEPDFLLLCTKAIANERARLLEEFTKAYLAHLLATTDQPIDMSRVQLVEELSNDGRRYRWYFEYKTEKAELSSGRNPNGEGVDCGSVK